MHSSNPYSNQPERAFWRKAAASQHITDIMGLFDGVPDLAASKIATAGSCFARHIGKFLKSRGLQYLDYEPAPATNSTGSRIVLTPCWSVSKR
jgi:hypothetical protein